MTVPLADQHDPADFTLAVEVVSSDSEREDRVVKPGLYADAGVELCGMTWW